MLVSDHVVDQFHSARKQFLQAVIDNLGARYPEMELVDSFSVFILRNLLKLGDEQIDRYGIRQVDILARHFSKEQIIEGQAAQPVLVDYDMAVSDWILLRSLMSTVYRGMNCELTVCFQRVDEARRCVSRPFLLWQVQQLFCPSQMPHQSGNFQPQTGFDKAAEPNFGRNPRPAHENFHQRPAK